jgi:hypothetical protein
MSRSKAIDTFENLAKNKDIQISISRYTSMSSFMEKSTDPWLKVSILVHPLPKLKPMYVLQQIQQRILDQGPNVSHTNMQYDSYVHRILESPIPTARFAEVESAKNYLQLRWATPSGKTLSWLTSHSLK